MVSFDQFISPQPSLVDVSLLKCLVNQTFKRSGNVYLRTYLRSYYLPCNIKFTNQKGQTPPRRLFILTRGIQIRGQPIKNYKKIF